MVGNEVVELVGVAGELGDGERGGVSGGGDELERSGGEGEMGGERRKEVKGVGKIGE